MLDLPSASVAELLDTTTASVNSALQRARARLAELGVDPDAQAPASAEQRAVVDRFVAAFEQADIVGLGKLLADDVVLEMPPVWNWYRGPDDFAAFMRRILRTRGDSWRTVPVWGNGEAGFAAFAAGELRTVSLFTVEQGLISRMTVFQELAIFDLFEPDR